MIGELNLEEVQSKYLGGWITGQEVLSSEQRKLLLENRLTDLECKYVHENHCVLAILQKMLQPIQSHGKLILVIHLVRVLFLERHNIKKKKLQVLKKIVISTLRSLASIGIYNMFYKAAICFIRRPKGMNSSWYV